MRVRVRVRVRVRPRVRVRVTKGEGEGKGKGEGYAPRSSLWCVLARASSAESDCYWDKQSMNSMK